MAPLPTPVQKATSLRIGKALARPGATGMKGFLLWTEAAWPKAIADKVIAAANQYTPGAGPVVTMYSPVAQGFNGLGMLGVTTAIDPNTGGAVPLQPGQSLSVDPNTGDTLIINTDGSTTDLSTGVTSGGPANAPVPSPTTQATASAPASLSWLSSIGTAITAATQAALGVTQAKDAQSIFNVNLQRAQQGLAPIPTNPTTYGLPPPTAQVGLTSTTQTALLWGIGILAVGLIAAGALGGRRAGAAS